MLFSHRVTKVRYKLKHFRIAYYYYYWMSYLSLQAIELARSNNISILKLPSHTTIILWPLHKGCFRLFKIFSDKKLENWEQDNNDKMNNNEQRRISNIF